MDLRKTLIAAIMAVFLVCPIFAQTGHWSEPVPVASINTYYQEYCPSISPDGQTLYFASGNRIKMSHWNGQDWDIPIDAGPEVNAGQRQISATVTPDNRTLYFTSWRSGGYGTYDIWRSYWQDSCQCWGPAEVMPPPISTDYMEPEVQLSRDGKKMYITSNRPFGWGGLDIWCSNWDDSIQNWAAPVNLGLGINSSSDDESAYPSSDGNTLYFNSWGPHGFQYPQWWGPVDLFIAHYNGQTWGNIEIMPQPITTGYWETGPAISNDGLTLYFASTRPGGPGLTDIYESRLITGIEEGSDNLPVRATLKQNYPNPFNSSTTIEFTTAKTGVVTLEIYDILGRRVQQLSDGIQSVGNHRVTWDAEGFASGIYFYRLQAGDLPDIRKMILIK